MATGDVIRWESHRGRSYVFDEIEGGYAHLWLNNRHGRYDPTYGASPYSGKLLPLKQTVITAAKPNAPATWKRQFTGYVEDWDFERKGPRHEIASVRLLDGFELLARAEVAPSMKNGAYFAAAHVDDRIRAALADARWPAARTQVNTGNVDMQPVLYPPGTSALEVIRDAAEAEMPTIGQFFVTKEGVARFIGRCARFTAPVKWQLGDAPARELNPTLIPIFDVKWSYEKEHLYNKAIVAPAGVEVDDSYLVFDQASIDKYGPRALPPITDLLIAAGSTTGNTAVLECRNVFAQYFVDNFKRAYVRAHSLEVRASFMEAAAGSYLDPLWDFMLNVEIGDLLELNTIHPGGGGLNALPYYVEGIHNYVEPPYSWKQVLDLGPKGRFDQRSYLGC